MDKVVVVGLRALLIGLGLGCILGQAVIIPVMASDLAREFPEVAFLQVPYTLVAVLIILCIEIAFVAVWRLLTMVAQEQIFAERAIPWVNTIVWAALVSTVLSVGCCMHLLFLINAGGPGVLLLMVAALIGGLAFSLIMVVMRGLLVTATRMRSELDEVI